MSSVAVESWLESLLQNNNIGKAPLAPASSSPAEGPLTRKRKAEKDLKRRAEKNLEEY
jgi:hypothetical protein